LARELNYIFVDTDVNAKVRIEINGFPLRDRLMQAGLQWMDILNLHLTGVETLTVRATAPGPVTLRLRLSRYEDGMLITPEDGTALPIRMHGAVDEPPRGPDGSMILASPIGVLAEEMEVQTRGFDFSSVYRTGAIIPEPVALQAAQRVLAAFDAGDTTMLTRMAGGKIADFAIAWGAPEPEIQAMATTDFAEMIAEGPVEHGTPPAITLHPAVEGRLVEARLDGEALLRAGQAPLTSRYPIFLGMRNGLVTILR
jgi:hypothetical protein